MHLCFISAALPQNRVYSKTGTPSERNPWDTRWVLFAPQRVWTTEMWVSVTMDKIRTHEVFIGLDTGRFQLLPSCYISDTSSPPQCPTVLRVRLQLPSMCGHSGHGEEGDLLWHPGITASPWETAVQILLPIIIIITWWWSPPLLA